MRKLLAVPALAAVTVAVVGCGTQTFDTDKLQTTLSKDITSQLKAAGSDLKVSCPDSPKAEKGQSFTCSTTIGGKKQTIKVNVTNDDGDIDWSMTTK
jgi:hypothetical protein